MLFFMDRSRRGPDPWLTWKVRLFQAGAVVAVLGMVAEANWMVAVAVGILGVGFALRFIPHPSSGEDGSEDGAEESA